MKKSKRMRSYSRKRVTMRRHMRNKRGGLLRLFQNDLLVDFKKHIENEPQLAACLKTFKDSGKPFSTTNSDCIDNVVPNLNYLQDGNGNSSLRWWLEHCSELDLLKYIEETKEGKNFYKYVLFKLLAEKESNYEASPHREDIERYHMHENYNSVGKKISRSEWATNQLASLKKTTLLS